MNAIETKVDAALRRAGIRTDMYTMDVQEDDDGIFFSIECVNGLGTGSMAAPVSVANAVSAAVRPFVKGNLERVAVVGGVYLNFEGQQ
jgi:hypothetical protein